MQQNESEILVSLLTSSPSLPLKKVSHIKNWWKGSLGNCSICLQRSLIFGDRSTKVFRHLEGFTNSLCKPNEAWGAHLMKAKNDQSLLFQPFVFCIRMSLKIGSEPESLFSRVTELWLSAPVAGRVLGLMEPGSGDVDAVGLGDLLLPCLVWGACLRRGSEDHAEPTGSMWTDTLFGLKPHLVRCSYPVKH